MVDNINLVLWDALQPNGYTGYTEYHPRGIALAGGNHRLPGGNWAVPLDLNLPILNLRQLPPPPTTIETKPTTISQDDLKEMVGPDWDRYSPPRRPQMELNPAYVAKRDIPRAMREAVQAEERRERRREKRKQRRVEEAKEEKARLAAAKLERRETTYEDPNQGRQFWVQRGLAPSYSDREDDTEDDPDLNVAAKLKVRFTEARKQRLNRERSHLYREIPRVVLRTGPINDNENRASIEAGGSGIDEADRRNSMFLPNGATANDAETQDSNEAGRQDSNEGQGSNTSNPPSGPFSMETLPRRAAKSMKEEVVTQSLVEEDDSLRVRAT